MDMLLAAVKEWTLRMLGEHRQDCPYRHCPGSDHKQQQRDTGSSSG